jgi:tetratricopeptide (TPR) repeat protein
MKITGTQLQRVRELYLDGNYLQAYRHAVALAPLTEWEGTDAMLLAGRLANNLGAAKLGRKLHLQAYRRDPGNGEAAYYKARVIRERRGPLAAWHFLRQIGETLDASTTVQADWLAYHAVVLGALRDFDAAEEWLAKAEKLDPTNPWIWIERSHLYELEDKYEEALAASQRALALHPYFRPGVQAAASDLVLLGRDEEALALLADAATKIESCWLVVQLAQLQTELGQHAAARQNYERFAELAPLLDQGTEQWLHAQRADAAYLCGDYEAALHYTQLSESPFHKLVTERMQAATDEAQRIVLPVGFVRQHHMTCAPATLTFLSRFWQQPTDHLSVVEAICYDGTPARSERDWAEKQGWFVREFCVNWDDTVKLIDRGVPFTLTTVEPGNAHLQSVIGYDSRRGTILVRDPYNRDLVEFAAKEMLERYRASGPRGMAMVPIEQKHLLEALELHEAPLYDKLYEVQQALYAHDRAQADNAIQAMVSAAENHRLTWQAQLSVAEYDSDDVRVLACLDKLLELLPDDANWRLYKLSVLRRMARRDERMQLLKEICDDRKSHPLFWQMYADELSDDGREQTKVRKLLQRTFRYHATDAHNFYLLANLHWSQQRFATAKELYRFAACLKDTNESYMRSYFTAAQHFHEQAEAVRFLRSRLDRFGKRSGSPARTLAWAYEQTGQEPRALAVLREGLALRPDDADLLLYTADVLARQGKLDEADQLIRQAEGKARRLDWLQAAAAQASYRSDAQAALKLWQEVAELDPLNVNAARHVAQGLTETSSEAEALAFLRARVAQFPHNLALHRLLVEWSRNDARALEQAVRAMIEVDPVDAWAHRELALALMSQQRYQEALPEAELAQKLEPNHCGSYNVLAKLYTETNQTDAAKAAYRQAIKLSVDSDYAIAKLIELSHSAAERRAALQFVQEELIRQVTFGDGLLAFREHARGTLDAEELRDVLQSALQARPDLWHAWSALVLHLIDMQQYDEALPLAEQAAEFFPLIPRIWFDLSLVQQARLDRAGEIAALERALEINPSWARAVRQLADAYTNSGELEKARALLEQAIVQAPLESVNYGYLADVLWRLDEKDQAIERMKRAVTLMPEYDWGWNTLRDWVKELQREDEVVALVRELADKNAHQAGAWILIAETLSRPEDLPERLRALDRANEINPRLIEAHVWRAQLLAEAGRLDEARAACRPAIFNGDWPVRLRNAAARIEATSGNFDLAIERMSEVVAEEPNNYEGWSCLADWMRRNEDRWPEYLQVATELVRISPQYVVSLGYLGEARKLNGDRNGAKEMFQRALALEAGYAFAGFQLFDLQLTDNELDAARATLHILQQHIGGDEVLVAELELAARENKVAVATSCFRKLCRSATATRTQLNSAIKTLTDKLWGDRLDAALGEAMEWPDANPLVGEWWVERWFERDDAKNYRARLETLPQKNAVWHSAATAYLEKLAQARRGSEARQFIAKFAADLRQEMTTWGMVGFVLLETRQEKQVAEWLSDWPTRTGLQPWMLWNGVLALRSLKRDAEAHQWGQHALTLPGDHLSAAHQILVTFDDVLAGDAERGAEQLRTVNYDELTEWQKIAYDTTVLMIEFYRALAQQMGSGWQTIFELGRMRGRVPYFWKDEVLYRSHLRATQQIAQDATNPLVQALAYLLTAGMYLKRTFLRS